MIQDTSSELLDKGVTSLSNTYHNADVFMLCISVDCEDNLDERLIKWKQVIRNVSPNALIALVLTKYDLVYSAEILQPID